MSTFAAQIAGSMRLATLSVCAIASLILPAPGGASAAESGIDSPEAIGPFLNGVFPSQAPGPSGAWTYKRVFPLLVANLPTFAGSYPGQNKFMIVEKDGRILIFDNTPNVFSSTVFLDIRDRVFSNSDSGMTYFAFHPKFLDGTSHRYVYITYKYSPDGDSGTASYWRLSRFSVPDGQMAADPNSELILINQYDRQQWHDSGCLLFGPDGYLYAGIGDEGGADDQYDDSQKINDRLFSGILRIDVDMDPTRSHPIRRQPLAAPGQPSNWPVSYTANYTIPNDNPFLDPNGGVLEEFYCMGNRNPYRFAYDPATGEIWEAEVGQNTREEVNNIVKGGNYGWAFREGFVAGPKSQPSTLIGTLMEPLWDYDRSLGGCAIGGYFYYGSEHPSLLGKYLVVDNTSGRIWALSRSSETTASAEYLTSMPSGSIYSGTSTCLEMPDGEIYFVKLGSGTQAEIYKLARTGAAVADPPALLSQTGTFSNLASLTAAPGLIPYNVNAPLWSDAALKRRWIAIPNDGTPDSETEKIRFAPESEWEFPPGTVFVKHFELADDADNPDSIRRLETRFLVISSTGEPYGVTYRWRPDGSDADLLTSGMDEEIPITLAGGAGGSQTWSFPSRANCMLCHNVNAKYVLGVRTHQLNSDLVYPQTGRTANQLSTLGSLGFFDDAYHPEHLAYFLKSEPLTNIAAPLETRVRSYIDSNCSQCHRPGGARANFDARFVTPLQNQNLIRGEVESQVNTPDEAVIYPGDLAKSVLHLKDAIVGTGQMPPLAKNVVDSQWIGVLEDWIQSLGSGPAVRLARDSTAGSNVQVSAVFTNSVTGLTPAGFKIRGGTVSSVTGSGATYTVQVSPTTGTSTIHIELPAGSAFASGLPNFASNKLVVDLQDPDLVTWFRLDETSGGIAHDSSAGANTGAVTGISSDDWIPGKYGNALRFDDAGARITVANNLGDDFTISFWMKTSQDFPTTDNPIDGVPLFRSDAPGPANDFTIAGTRSTGGLNRISFLTGQSGGSNVTVHGIASVSTGDWVHVAVRRVKAFGNMRLYVNGAQVGNGTGSMATLNAAPLIQVGSSSDSPEQFVGQLDEVRFYNRPLVVGEVADLASEAPSVGSLIDDWFAANLPGLFHLHDLDLDPDQDGVDNGGELVLSGNPLARDGALVSLTVSENLMSELEFLMRSDVPGVGIDVWFSNDLVHWFPAGARIGNVQDNPSSDPSYMRRTMDFSPMPDDETSRMFFRIDQTDLNLY